MTSLAHCIYASAAVVPPDGATLREMLDASRAKNRRLDISGMLLYADGSFFQVIEGPRSAVSELFATIARDPRHRLVTRIIDEPIARRSFADCSMAFPDLPDLRSLPGFAALLDEVGPMQRIEPGRARKLVAAFAAGRWRQRLSDVSPSLVRHA